MSSTINESLHNLITQAAGQYDVVFGADSGAFFMDVEQKSAEKLPFFGIFDTLRTWVDSFGSAVPIYAIYAFYSPDWADERKETTTEEITAAQLLRLFLQNLSPYLKNTPSDYNRFDGGAVSGVWASAAIAVPLDCESVPIIVPPSGDVSVTPLAVTDNGTYTAPTGVAYSPVTVNVPPPSANYVDGSAYPAGITYVSGNDWSAAQDNGVIVTTIPNLESYISASGDIIYYNGVNSPLITNGVVLRVSSPAEQAVILSFFYIGYLQWRISTWDGKVIYMSGTAARVSSWRQINFRGTIPEGSSRLMILRTNILTLPFGLSRIYVGATSPAPLHAISTYDYSAGHYLPFSADLTE